MTASMNRTDWLEDEIQADREYVERYSSSDDPIERAQAERRQRDADAKAAELAELRGDFRFSLRLTGRNIPHHNAPINVVRGLITQLETMANEFGADMMVAPAAAGSHVIEVTGPDARSLFEDEPAFDPDQSLTEATQVLLQLAAPTWGNEDTWEGAVEQVAADLSPAALLAARHFAEILAGNHINVEMTMRGRRGSGTARLTQEQAAFVDRVLRNVTRETETIEIDGILIGFTKGSGRFEVQPADGSPDVAGNVPKALRNAADGIPIGSRVHVTVEEVTTTLRSGSVRRYHRLAAIEPERRSA